MEKNYMNPDSIVEFEFIEDQQTSSHYHENPEILFVLEGELTVTTDQQTYRLKNEDFILINAGRSHSYAAEKQLLAVRFQISADKLTEILHRKSIIFWCCSVMQDSAPVEELRKLLKNILFYDMGQGQKDAFYRNSLYYQLLGSLCGNFLLEDKKIDTGDDSEQDRMAKVLEYIRANYRNPISLQDVADELFLSTTYLSKYVRKQSGMGFVELINSVRLAHAMEDLMYTDSPVIKVAMDNGFASVAALNKVFKETYDTTPSNYRKDKKRHTANSVYMEKAAEYLHDHLNEGPEAQTDADDELVLDCFEGHPAKLTQILNAGRAVDLLNAAIQKQIITAKQQLGIRYVRFWNIFSEEMYLDHMPEDGKVNYSKLYAVIDFLRDQNIIPYFELRMKHHIIRATAEKVLHDKNPKKILNSDEDYITFYDDFFAHLRRRYGIGEVSTWLFNYPIENEIYVNDHSIDYKLMDEERWEMYLDEFDLVAETFRKRLPNGNIGGAGFPVQHFGRDKLITLLKHWRMHRNFPNFITITSFPYQIVENEGRWFESRRTDLNFVRDDVESVKSAMAASGFGHLPLHLIECNLTLSDRSYINDTLMRGAFFAHVLTQVYNRVDMLGVWNAFDSYSDYVDSSRYIFGGSGMYTRSGVAKPAGRAFRMFESLYKDCMIAKDGCLITRNEHNHYKILVNNLVNMNTAYYLKDEDQFSALSIEQMRENDDHKKIHIRVKNAREGEWQIRQRSVNSNSGYVLGEWLNLNIDTEIRSEEQKYLENVCAARIRIDHKTTFRGDLEFDIDLEPNEVKYIHITEFD